MGDVGKILRVRGAIQATLEGLADSEAVMAGDAVGSGYTRLRKEVAAIVPSEDREEFDRLFPESAGSFGHRPMDKANKYHAAKGLLGQLAGWLRGYVDEAQFQAKADAYARERMKQGRGVGFKPSE
jgi:hypothetical protein